MQIDIESMTVSQRKRVYTIFDVLAIISVLACIGLDLLCFFPFKFPILSFNGIMFNFVNTFLLSASFLLHRKAKKYKPDEK